MRTAIALILVVGCATTRPVCPTPTVPTNARAFVWEVRGTGAPIILFGTHHAAGKRDVPFSVVRELDSAELFVAEVAEGGKDDSLDSPNARWNEALELPRGQSLMKLMSDDDFMDMRERLGMSSAALSRTRPWVALGLLIKTVFEFPSPNMSHALAERAEERKVAMEYLDDWELQKVFLDLTVGVDDLAGALHHPDLRCSVESGVARYRAGDERSFVTATGGPPALATNEASAIAERERVWTEKIAAYARSGKRVFVAIGVANIVGPRGLAARLADAGFTVTRR